MGIPFLRTRLMSPESYREVAMQASPGSDSGCQLSRKWRCFLFRMLAQKRAPFVLK
jgi:hypothetical protein